MGLFDIFKNKKTKHNIYCEFNFDKAPELLDIYNEYKDVFDGEVISSEDISDFSKFSIDIF